VTCFPFVHSPVETAKPQEHPLETFQDGPPDSSSPCSQSAAGPYRELKLD